MSHQPTSAAPAMSADPLSSTYPHSGLQRNNRDFKLLRRVRALLDAPDSPGGWGKAAPTAATGAPATVSRRGCTWQGLPASVSCSLRAAAGLAPELSRPGSDLILELVHGPFGPNQCGTNLARLNVLALQVCILAVAGWVSRGQ